MASEEELRKINVRSPYFVNVTKPVSLGGEEPIDTSDLIVGDDTGGGSSGDTGGGEEPFVEPTEPTVTTTTINCGDTRSNGATIGVHRYEISTVGKQTGDYDMDFTGIVVPFYAKIGIKGNMPSTYTFMEGNTGWDIVWLNAVGTATPSSTDSNIYPDGNDQTITYTSTQSDIDTYGETVLLELFFPILDLANSNFTANCPNAVTAVVEDEGQQGSVGQQSVFVMTLYNGRMEPGYLSGNVNQLNGQDAPWLSLPDKSKVKTYVFGNYSPNLEPVSGDGFKYLNSYDMVGWNNAIIHEVVYRPATDLNNNQNIFKFKQSMQSGNTGVYKIWLSKHRIELVTDATRNNDEAFATWQNVPDSNMNIHTVSRLTQEGLPLNGGGQGIYVSGYLPEQTFTINTVGLLESASNPNSNHLIESTFNIKSYFANATYKLIPHNDAQNIEIWTPN